MLDYESKYWSAGIKNIAGIDEAGRGPLAGPVVSASVILPKNINLPEVNDSKKLSEKKRERLFNEIYLSATSIGIGIVHESEIDIDNILQATYKSMRKSLGALSVQPEIILVDGNKADIKHYEQENIINGDQKSLSIAAASIIAKVTRDRIMKQYDLVFPDYAFGKHKGYGTKNHIEKIKLHKAVPIHRKTFNPVPKYLPSIAFYKHNKLIETLGIQLVACRMIRNNYFILKINYISQDHRKVDIIAEQNNIINFISVKTNVIDSMNQIESIHFLHDKNNINDDLASSFINDNNLDLEYKYQNFLVTIGNGKPEIKSYEYEKKVVEIN